MSGILIDIFFGLGIFHFSHGARRVFFLNGWRLSSYRVVDPCCNCWALNRLGYRAGGEGRLLCPNLTDDKSSGSLPNRVTFIALGLGYTENLPPPLSEMVRFT